MESLHFPLALILPNVHAYRDLVHGLYKSEQLEMTEFTYRYPLFKGSEKIVDGLAHAQNALEKFDVYFRGGAADVGARLFLAKKFRERFLMQNPRSEGSDVFKASGNILEFTFVFDEAALLENKDALVDATGAHPYDQNAFALLKSQGQIDAAARTARLAIFLDHVHNPVRQKDPAVKAALGDTDAVICELYSSGALPGLFMHALAPFMREVFGQLVFVESVEVR